MDVSSSLVGEIAFQDSSFVENYSGYAGGAVQLDDDSHGYQGAFRLSNVLFDANSTEEKGGALRLAMTSVDTDTSLTVEDCTFSGNASLNRGGALALGGGIHGELLATVVDTSFAANTASTGGAIWTEQLLGHAALELVDSSVMNNSGGGIWASGAHSLECVNVDFGTQLTDNVPYDITTEEQVYDSFGAGESFYCDGSGACY